MKEPEWMNDASLTGIDKEKLQFLQMMVSEGQGMSPKEMLPFLMRVTKRGKESSIAFSHKEMELVISVLKQNSSPEEIERINKILKIWQQKSN